MKFTDFFTLINNTHWDVKDLTNRDQCFDLVNGWCKAMGMTDSEFAGILYAKDLWYKPTANMRVKFDFIQNTPTAVPKEGDIVVFDGTVGHTSVATGKGNITTFESFDQNYPTGSACHLVIHNYNSPKVLGWLRAKQVAGLPIELQQYTLNWKDICIQKGLDVNAPQFVPYRAIDVIISNKVQSVTTGLQARLQSIKSQLQSITNSI